MKKAEKVSYILNTLDQLYPAPPIPLVHRDHYTLLIAVLLSAHSTDKAVNRVTPELFALADTPDKMARLPLATIESVVRPCGLAPRKARAIKELSQILMEKHQGKVPDNFIDLEALPGVGHKTASVVLSQAFGQLAFPVDTHIHRLAQRWGLTSGRSVKQTEEDLKKIFPSERWNKLHLQMIYFGREYCQARRCDGTKCQICQTLNT